MNSDRVSRANDRPPRAEPPRKLHKPRRDSADLRPEQVVPYIDETPCDPSAVEVGGE